VGGYLIRQCGSIERAALILSGILLFYAGIIQDILGFFILAIVVLLQIIKVRADRKVATTKVV
jgi:large-conductance mechanosensitive channel